MKKRQVVLVLLCGQFPFAKCAKDEPTPGVIHDGDVKSLGHPAALITLQRTKGGTPGGAVGVTPEG